MKRQRPAPCDRLTVEQYRARRRELLVELRLIRMTRPAPRVVKHVQGLMRGLRTYWRTRGAP